MARRYLLSGLQQWNSYYYYHCYYYALQSFLLPHINQNVNIYAYKKIIYIFLNFVRKLLVTLGSVITMLVTNNSEVEIYNNYIYYNLVSSFSFRLLCCLHALRFLNYVFISDWSEIEGHPVWTHTTSKLLQLLKASLAPLNISKLIFIQGVCAIAEYKYKGCMCTENSFFYEIVLLETFEVRECEIFYFAHICW